MAKLQNLLQNNAASNSVGAAYADAANAFMSEQAAIIANGPWMSSDFESSNSDKWSNGFDGAKVRASLFPGDVGIADSVSGGSLLLPLRMKLLLQRLSLSSFTAPLSWKPTCWPRVATHRS